MSLKVELHSHTSDDPCDYIPHTATALIDRAAALGYGALAITLHRHQLDIEPLVPYARALGVVLIRGVEQDIERRHVLLLNYGAEAARVRTVADLERLRRATPEGLVVAPHPFYPLGSCVGALLERRPDLFDAVEVNAFWMRGVDFNRRARRFAREHGKPLVGNCDVHRLTQLGPTYSLVEAKPDADAICAAIRAGRVDVRTEPLSIVRTGLVLAALAGGNLWRRHRLAPSRRVESQDADLQVR